MQYTEQDRQVLHDTWMSHKAKMRITQIEMAKKLGLTQLEFSDILRGSKTIESGFVNDFCNRLGVDPVLTLPSLRQKAVAGMPGSVMLKNTITLDGTVQNVTFSDNQVVIEYEHNIKA
ncbi:XRE family transcriptional regulator [Photobacterium damselae]|uniref:XRE family transcriptional regulator n=1 Tax=Photobacterium damselae TaxID=38293 RepID=UPI004067E0E2